MEAPEKIWINPSMDLPKLNGVIDKESVQYTRTDAFIEKACEWLSSHFYDEEYQFCDDEGTWIDADCMIEDFKKYMED